MRKLLMLLALSAILISTAIFQGDAQAAPGLMDAGNAAKAVTGSVIQKVHGCHRRAKKGPWTGIWHRHKGNYCIWTPAKKRVNPCRKWRRRCERRCEDARRPGKCFRHCYRRNAPGFCRRR